MQTDATSANNSQHCWVLLANNVASVCMDLKVWPVSNYTQQVPTLLWFHANGRNKSQHCWAHKCWVLLANNVGSVCMGLKVAILALITALSVPSFSLCVYSPFHVFPQIIVLNDTSQSPEFFLRRSISCSTSWSDHLLVHLFAFFGFLPKRLMFPQIIRSTRLDRPCLQQSRKKKTHYNRLFFEKILQGACADVFTRPTLLGFHTNGRNILALCFAGHRTTEMLGLVGPKVWPVSNCDAKLGISSSMNIGTLYNK